ncbi:hypothetical protein GCM10027443_08650 [Pontibacter brevis]
MEQIEVDEHIVCGHCGVEAGYLRKYNRRFLPKTVAQDRLILLQGLGGTQMEVRSVKAEPVVWCQWL